MEKEFYKESWGGCLSYINPDGKIVNMAKELNNLETEKNDNDNPKDKERT